MQQEQQQQLPRKLRVLCLHSWRTSGDIFKQQFRRVNLDVALADLMDFVSQASWLRVHLHLLRSMAQHSCLLCRRTPFIATVSQHGSLVNPAGSAWLVNNHKHTCSLTQ
jgi:hypothetical protein